MLQMFSRQFLYDGYAASYSIRAGTEKYFFFPVLDFDFCLLYIIRQLLMQDLQNDIQY